MSRTTCANSAGGRALTIAWANVGRGHSNHITLLQVAGEAGMDIICVQEPRLYENSATQNHAAYDRFQPIDTWGATDGPERGPRVITYVRKGGNLKVRQMRQTGSRDLLWVNINGYSILNAYRAPLEPRTMEYILGLEIAPGTGTVVGGDFNAKYDLWEPGVPTAGQGDALAQWASDQGMEYIGTPGAQIIYKPQSIDNELLNLVSNNEHFFDTAGVF
ncbi:hypothetical protein EYC80_002718 [Monilinia laxa]|uniref:Endonuclease/exonuclease/phosphatase domain-containing protein n=1 Tax=Monilinia laxa TaxID=61186 RepID=A0A5N6K4X9_MONLA|nr:hypothetical protein EYC80_002718 [Monilinia laxa]